MKQLKITKTLQRYVFLARAEGLRVGGGVNGGGWDRLAASCGYSGDGTRSSVKEFLRNRFISSAIYNGPGTIPVTQQSITAPVKSASSTQPTEQSVKSFINNHSKVDPASDDFLNTFEWKALRMMALKQHGAVCQCCGASPATGAVMHVDHIKPRRFYPELALDVGNLQILCGDCNHGKGSWDMTDWRKAA